MVKIPHGYILLARKITKSGIMDKPPLYLKLWIWMLEQANHKTGRNGLKRGQFITTIDEMREAMSWHIGYRKVTPTKKEIRNPYEWFTKGTMIGTTKVTHGMIITILNYDEYQNPKIYEGHSEGHDEKYTKGEGGAQFNNKKEREECKERNKNIKPEIFDFVEKFQKHQQENLGEKLVHTDEETIQNGADALDKLCRLDKFSFKKEIKPALFWAVENDFWRDKIVSLGNIRKKSSNGNTKFQNLFIRFEKDNPKKPEYTF